MILVDTPRWTWKGQVWGHLVSDTSLEELHEFARNIGKRRIGFQGDHYDVNTDERLRAIEAGALSVDSRELIRRLRQAGLRDRSKKPRWDVVYESERKHTIDQIGQIVASSISDENRRCRLTGILTSARPPIEALRILIVERPNAAALVLECNEFSHLDSDLVDVLNQTRARERYVVELIVGDE